MQEKKSVKNICFVKEKLWLSLWPRVMYVFVGKPTVMYVVWSGDAKAWSSRERYIWAHESPSFSQGEKLWVHLLYLVLLQRKSIISRRPSVASRQAMDVLLGWPSTVSLNYYFSFISFFWFFLRFFYLFYILKYSKIHIFQKYN